MPIRPLGGRCALQHVPKIAIGAALCQRDLRESGVATVRSNTRGYRRAQESTCRLRFGVGYSERSASVGWIRSGLKGSQRVEGRVGGRIGGEDTESAISAHETTRIYPSSHQLTSDFGQLMLVRVA